MMLIQFVLSGFFLFAILKVFLRFRSGDLNIFDLVLWVVFWLAAEAVVLRPDSTMDLARLLGVGRGVDAVVYLAVALLFFLFFRVIVKIENINRDVTKLTRKITLLSVEQKDSNKKI